MKKVTIEHVEEIAEVVPVEELVSTKRLVEMDAIGSIFDKVISGKLKVTKAEKAAAELFVEVISKTPSFGGLIHKYFKKRKQ